MPSLNQVIAKAKKHYGSYSSMKKDATTKVKLACLTIPKLPKKLRFNIEYVCKNKRMDKDNVASAKKFIFDGLVEANKMTNDGWEEIDGWTESFSVDKKNPRIIVTIFL